MGPTAALAVDALRVTVNDRIVMSANFTASAVAATAPSVAAVTRYTRIQEAQFFANAAQTATSEVKLILNCAHTLGHGLLDWGVSMSYFDTTLEGGARVSLLPCPYASVLFEDANCAIIEDFQAFTRLQGIAEYSTGRGAVRRGARYFGSYILWRQPGLIARSQNQTFSPKTVTDVHCAVRPSVLRADGGGEQLAQRLARQE